MFEDVKVGDTVTRDFFSNKQKMKVTKVTAELITAGMGWTFDPKTGAEIDDDLGYGPKYGVTCSSLVKDTK